MRPDVSIKAVGYAPECVAAHHLESKVRIRRYMTVVGAVVRRQFSQKNWHDDTKGYKDTSDSWLQSSIKQYAKTLNKSHDLSPVVPKVIKGLLIKI